MEILGEAAALDAAEDELYGDERGDELPPGVRNQGDRRTRLRESKQALQAKRAAQAKPVPRDRGERLHECRRRLYEEWALERRVVADHAAWLAAGVASDGSRRMTGARHNIKPYPLSERPASKINLTDPDARTLKSPRGWVLGYNAQAVVTDAQIIVAAEVATENIDRANLQPLVPDRLPRAARSRRGAGARARVRPDQAQRGAERFQRRRRSAARSEWRLLAATHNVLKLWRHNTAAATA